MKFSLLSIYVIKCVFQFPILVFLLSYPLLQQKHAKVKFTTRPVGRTQFRLLDNKNVHRHLLDSWSVIGQRMFLGFKFLMESRAIKSKKLLYTFSAKIIGY